MPILTEKISDLHLVGPTIQVTITPHPFIAAELRKAGKEIPFRQVTALIDTGASSTCIAAGLALALNILPRDIQTVHSPAGETKHLLYDLGVLLPFNPNTHFAIQALSMDFQNQPIQALIGRDILKYCTLFYSGVDNSFTLHF